MKQVRTNTKKILLVDHEDSTREIFRSVLESAGHQIIVARSREEALKKIDKKLPDVIISEAELPPEKSGFHFYKHLKADAKTINIPFVFLTGVDSRIVQKLLKPNDIHIEKPVQSQLFLEKVDTFIKKRFPQQDEKKTTQRQRKVEKSIIKILDFQIDKLPKPEKRKALGYPIMPLPPGHSTKFFSVPSGIFDLKMMKSTITKALKLFKSGTFQIKESSMLFPSIALDAPMERLVPINIPKPSKESVDEEIMMVDLDLNESEAAFLEEFDESSTEQISNEGLKEAFLQYFDKRAFDFQLGIFETMLVLDQMNTVVYNDIELNETSETTIQITWENILYSLRSLLVNLNMEEPTSYIWVETEETNLLMVNSPEKNVIPFLQIQESPPIEVLFNEHIPEAETFEKSETFFLLPSLSCNLPLISKKKLKDLLLGLEVNFVNPANVNAVVHNTDNGELIATTTENLEHKKMFMLAYNIFSVSGLCSQSCSMGFELDYVDVEAESQNFLFVNDANKGIYISCITEKFSF